MAVLSVSLSKNIDKRMEKEYTLIDKVFFDLTAMSTDQEEKKRSDEDKWSSYVCKNIRNRKFSSRKISEQR